MKVIDLHCDMLTHLGSERLKQKQNIFKNKHLNNFKQGEIYLSVFNLWLDEHTTDYESQAKLLVENALLELNDNLDCLNKVENANQIVENKINYILGIEGLDFLNCAIDLIDYYQQGFRLVSLTWNNDNKYAASIKTKNDYGLTKEGVKLVKMMNELNMIIDISHASDKSAKQILQLSTKPVIASHSNVQQIASHPRNLNDELIRMIAKSNGVIGLNAYPAFIAEQDKDKNLPYLLKHIAYLKQLVGIEYIALGFDFMDFLSDESLEFLEAKPYLDNFKNQSYLNLLLEELKKANYSQFEIDQITHLNALRVFKEILV